MNTTRAILTLILLLVSCDGSEPELARAAALPTAADCRLGDAPGVIPIGDGDGITAFAPCLDGVRCQARGPLLAESRVRLAIDVQDAAVPSHDYQLRSRSSQVLQADGSPETAHDGCNGHVRVLQAVIAQDVGAVRLLLHADGEVEDDAALATLDLEIGMPEAIELGDAGDDGVVDRLTLRGDSPVRIVATVRDGDGAALTTLGQEYWWVDDPELVSLAPVHADPDATTDEPAPPLQVRGTEVDLRALAEGTTRLHVLALNLEHTIELRVTP